MLCNGRFGDELGYAVVIDTEFAIYNHHGGVLLYICVACVCVVWCVVVWLCCGVVVVWCSVA